MSKVRYFIDYVQRLNSVAICHKRLVYILLFLIVLLSFTLTYLATHQAVYLVPYGLNEKIKIAVSEVSPQYLQSLALADTATYFNINKYNVKTQIPIFLSRVSSTYVANLSSFLSKKALEIEQHNLAQVFYPIRFETIAEQNMIRVHGNLQSYVGENLVENKRLMVEINYCNLGGHLYIAKWLVQDDVYL